ncbi:MAG: hypothetical protein LBC80_05200 [Treponema sp.]|jgi:hypothetical protein|nr:hypothetical protein [Treponema sp.]
MKKTGKIVSLCVVFFILATGQVFSDTPIDDLHSAVNSFSNKIAESLPFNSTVGLNWSDAYIGQFLGIPPRFGIGVTTGFTTIPISSMNNLLNVFGAGNAMGNTNMGLPLLSYTLEARIGGFILPFDFGVKFGYLPDLSIPFMNVGMEEYTLVGADLRYSLLPKIIPIFKASVGIGINHLRGGISTSFPLGTEFDFSDPTDTHHYKLIMTDPTLTLPWSTTSYELKAQASASLLIFTPYAGLGIIYAKSNAGYRIKTEVTIKDENGIEITDLDELDDVRDYLIGLKNFSPNGFERMIENTGFNVRAYGGVSLNLAVIKFDLTGLYNFTTQSYGLTFGARFQL